MAINPSNNPAEHDKLQKLRTAILDHKTVRMRYMTRHSSDGPDGQGIQTTREIDPYGLAFIYNTWFLSAYCHLRHDIRSFRLDRIESLEGLDRTFQRPADFSMQGRKREREIVVRVQFDREVTRWVRESHYYFVTEEQENDAGLLVTLQVQHESEVVQWLLSWGRHARVLEPEALQQRMFAETQAMLQQYQAAEKLSRY